jgi:hypothetical protein
MLVYVTDVVSNSSVAVNPTHVVSVLAVPEGEHKNKTAIVLVNGNIIVSDPLLDVVGKINGELR